MVELFPIAECIGINEFNIPMLVSNQENLRSDLDNFAAMQFICVNLRGI